MKSACKHVVAKSLKIWKSLEKMFALYFIIFFLWLHAFQKVIICFDKTILSVSKVESKKLQRSFVEQFRKKKNKKKCEEVRKTLDYWKTQFEKSREMYSKSYNWYLAAANK